MSMENIDNAFPLTPAQTGMLFHVLESPDSNVYMAYVLVTIKGSMDVSRLRESWHAVFRKHEALRAAFLWEGLDEPLQVIHSKIDLPWHVDYLQDCTNESNRREISAIGVEELCKPIDISEAPLSRVRLVQTGETEWKMIWSVHHLLADGWCTPIILSDLVTYYSSTDGSHPKEGGVEFVNEGFSFSEHVAWLANQDKVAALAHWREYLQGVECTPIRVKRRKVTGSEGTLETGPNVQLSPESTFTIGVDETRELGQFCRQNQITLSTLFHLSWALVLSEYCNTSKPLFGTTSSGRQSGLAGIETAVGMFLNTLPVFLDFSGAKTLLELLQDLQKSLHGNNQFEFASLTEIQKMVSRDRNEALFDCIIAIESHTGNELFTFPGADISISNIEYKAHSNYALSLLVIPGTEIFMRLLSDSQKFEFCFLEQMLPRFASMIRAVSSTPYCTAGEILASPALRHQQLKLSQGTRCVKSEHEKVHRWFEKTCDTHRQKLAIVASGRTLTFEQLDNRANQVARAILQRADSRDALIGVVLPRGCDLVASFLGVLKSGLAYVPMDPDLPDNKILQILKSAGIHWVISTQQWQVKLMENGVNALTMEQCYAECNIRIPESEVLTHNSTPGAKPESSTTRAQTRDLAYVMFTSGSTGTPKGVMVTHSNLSYSSAVRMQHYATPGPVFLVLSPMTFDSSVAGLYWALCGGGTVILPGPGEETDLDIVGSLISKYGVTHTLCLPSLYRLILQFVETAKLATLQSVIVAGEQCMQSVVGEHHYKLPKCSLHNEYGPTEATVWSTVAELKSDPGGEVSIGRAIGDSLILLLSSSGRLCPTGVIGEIHIGGRGVAAGYYQQAEQTAERFVDNPINPAEYPVLFRTGDLAYRKVNGELVFVGRADRQLKIRGNRIEPAEIESVLFDFPAVRDVVVVGRSLTQPSDSSASGTIPGVKQLTRALHSFSAHQIDELIREAELYGNSLERVEP